MTGFASSRQRRRACSKKRCSSATWCRTSWRRVEGDRAQARCYLLDFRTRAGKTQLLSPGEYECELRKEGGHWRFVRRVVVMDQAFGVDDL